MTLDRVLGADSCSTRTPSALPSALSQLPAFSAPLIALVQGGPVGCFR